MIASRQRLVEEIFKQAVALEPRARDILVRSRCGEDSALLAEVGVLLKMATNDDGFLDHTPVVISLDALGASGTEAPSIPDSGMIGPYRVQSILGSGGMGVVYLAEQARPHRTVALKVIRPDLATASVLRRFEFEAEVLGRLQHPGIAQIIEAGTHETPRGMQPYFAMELVHGLSLIGYCRERGVAMEDRIRLFIRVCEAVEHAHQRGVIHRDLKPANILVTADGQPKILDFGVARAVDAGEEAARLTMARTGERQLIGTIAYMSPEQVSGKPDEIDTRSDVYALGVVLFELLAGHLPHDLADKSLPEAVRLRAERDASKLSAFGARFRGDLDTIVGKALEREKARRFASASALAEDLQRYLMEQPINARPASAVYQMRKFARRYRGIVAAGALAVACLVAGLVSSTVAWKHAAQDRDAARRSAFRSEHMAGFLKTTLLSINPSTARGRDTTLLREILGQTRDRLQNEELRDDPQLRAELAGVVGTVYKVISRPADAEPLLREALDSEMQQPVREERAPLLMQYGFVRLVQGDHAGCFDAYDQAIRVYDQLGLANTRVGVDARRMVAEALRQSDQASRADAMMTELVPLARGLGAAEEMLLARCLQSWGLVKSDLGDHAAAERLLTEAAGLFEAKLGSDDYSVVSTISSLAADLHEQGRYAEAEVHYRRALSGFRRVYGEDNLQIANEMSNLALTLINLNRLEEATPLLRDAVAIDRKLAGPRSSMFANHLSTLGTLLRQQGRVEEAEGAYKEALPVLEATVGPNHVFTTDVLENLAMVASQQGHHEAAVRWIEDAAARAEQSDRSDPDWKLGLQIERGEMLLGWAIQQFQEGNMARAIEFARRARAVLEAARLARGEQSGGTERPRLVMNFTIGRTWVVECGARGHASGVSERIEMLDRAASLCAPYVRFLEAGPGDIAPINYLKYAEDAFDSLIEVLNRKNELEPTELTRLEVESAMARKEHLLDRIRSQPGRNVHDAP